MRRAVTILSIFFCAVIVFFSIFGERLYYLTKTSVEIDRPVMIDGALILPESAVFREDGGDYIFTVAREQGFSAEILTVTKHRLLTCVPDPTGYFGGGYVSVSAEDYSNELTVVRSQRPLRDGERVKEGENLYE